MRFLGPVALIGAIVLLVKLASDSAAAREGKRNQWRTIKTGTFDRVSYGVKHVEKAENEYGFGRDSGYRLRYRTAKEDVTTVIFEDGSTILLEGQVEVPFARGALISVSENGLGERSVFLASPGTVYQQ